MSRAVYDYFATMQVACSEAEKSCIVEACNDFSDQIAIDVKNFILQLTLESIEECPRKVIVFPEVNDLGHLLIDEIVKIFPNLVSFVVGPPKSKRIVVCSHAIVKNKVLNDLAAGEGDSTPIIVQDQTITSQISSEQQQKQKQQDLSTVVLVTKEEDSPSSSSIVTTNCDSSSSPNRMDSNSKETSNKLPTPTSPKPSETKSTNFKTLRPDGGIFRRVMTELYIAADRHKGENNDRLPLNSNNVTKPVNMNSPPSPSSVNSTSSTTPTQSSGPSNNDIDTNEDTSSNIPQPEEDDYWKKLTNIHLHEIHCILGSVEIVKPKWKQISCDMQISLKEQALNHILETYNMNEKIVTRDLNLMFAKFKTSGFNIKWVDHERALIIFSSAAKAAEALSVEHPVIKTRPVVIASRESKLRILQCSQFLLPYKDRPKTVATVARRMISNSLGREFETNPEIAEKERNIIKQARAEKLLKEKILSENLKFTTASPGTTHQSSKPVENQVCDDDSDLESFEFN